MGTSFPDGHVPDGPDAVVTLVPGTWAGKAAWIRADRGLAHSGLYRSDPVIGKIVRLICGSPPARAPVESSGSLEDRTRSAGQSGAPRATTDTKLQARVPAFSTASTPDRISLDTAHRRTAPYATRLHVIDVTRMS
jgi:hypothetical protein